MKFACTVALVSLAWVGGEREGERERERVLAVCLQQTWTCIVKYTLILHIANYYRQYLHVRTYTHVHTYVRIYMHSILTFAY